MAINSQAAAAAPGAPTLVSSKDVPLMARHGLQQSAKSGANEERPDLFSFANQRLSHQLWVTADVKVARIVHRFNEAHGVKNWPRSDRLPTIHEDKRLDVMQYFVENPHLSLRTAALQHNIALSSVD
ncbi:hypothetical protein J6590_077678 [Homalodisca vitripennis]|nr:hypothetical protein J6590_077678 [Homalodisca vitripennis]